jgi:hypothetical protein
MFTISFCFKSLKENMLYLHEKIQSEEIDGRDDLYIISYLPLETTQSTIPSQSGTSTQVSATSASAQTTTKPSSASTRQPTQASQATSTGASKTSGNSQAPERTTEQKMIRARIGTCILFDVRSQ